jgi:hypothetical protein
MGVVAASCYHHCAEACFTRALELFREAGADGPQDTPARVVARFVAVDGSLKPPPQSLWPALRTRRRSK